GRPAGGGVFWRAGGAVTPTWGSFSSGGFSCPCAMPAVVSATSAQAVRRPGLIPSPFPAEGLSLASVEPVFWLGDRPHPVPSRPNHRGSGDDRVRPPSQLRGSGGFAPPSPTHPGRGLLPSRPPARQASPVLPLTAHRPPAA